MKKQRLSDLIDTRHIIRDGFFANCGSAKIRGKIDILSYALTPDWVQAADANPAVSAIITLPALQDRTEKALVVHEEPDILFAETLNKLAAEGSLKPEMFYGIDATAVIHPSAQLGDKCFIGKNVHIGRNAIINDYSVIEEDCIIGDNVVIGCVGYYFRRAKSGKLIKLPHAGGVHIHKNAEILTGAVIQRAMEADFTVIGEGAKISVGVSIGHSVQIGKHSVILGSAVISGRTEIGNYCWIGPASAIASSLTIGDRAKVRIGSVVVQNIKEGGDVSGNFAIEHTRNIRAFARERR